MVTPAEPSAAIAPANAVATSRWSGSSKWPVSSRMRNAPAGRGLNGPDRPSGHHGIEPGGVLHRPRERADVIERRRQRHDAFRRYFARARLEADQAAARRRDSHGAARVGANRGEAHPARDGRGGTAARSAGRSMRILRMVHRAKGGVLARGPERELVQVRAPEDDRAGVLETRHQRRVARPRRSSRARVMPRT